MPQVVGRNGGEGTLAHWPTSSGMMTIEEASCEVLKYLNKSWESLSASGGSIFCFNIGIHLSSNVHERDAI